MFICWSGGSRDDFAASFAAGLATCCSKNSTWWRKTSAGKTGSFKPREFTAPFFHNVGRPRFHLLAHSPTHLQQFHGSSESGMSSRCFTKELSLRTPVDLARLSFPCRFLCGGESVSGVSVGSHSGLILHHRMCKELSCWGQLFL